MSSRLRHTAVIVTALFSFTACRGHSADSGGDVALARDLAEAQLAGSSASAGGRVASDSVDVAHGADASDPPATSAPVTAAPTVRNGVTRTAPSHKTSDRARKFRRAKQAPGDPCASSEAEDQNACLSLGVHRSNERLDSIYRQIVKAVRKQQRVPAGAADPPYATTLGQAEKTWASWRDAECQRVTHGKGGDRWAVPRAKCLATLTDERAAELTQILQKAQKH